MEALNIHYITDDEQKEKDLLEAAKVYAEALKNIREGTVKDAGEAYNLAMKKLLVAASKF